jgi:ABC-type transporter MlaC component
MRSLWSVIIIILIASQGVNAGSKEQNDPNYPINPNELIRTKWDAVISVLQSKDLDQDARIKKINKIVSPIFDFPLMAKLSLGKKHWPKLTLPQREKFTRLFIEKLFFNDTATTEIYTA